jgi:hypothetical protein
MVRAFRDVVWQSPTATFIGVKSGLRAIATIARLRWIDIISLTDVSSRGSLRQCQCVL